MEPMTPRERHMRKWMERAIVDFRMIEPGDRVLAAVSGGRDSLALFHLLTGPMVHVTKDFSIEFAHVDGGFPGSDATAIEKWLEDRGRKLHVVKSDIYGEFKDIKKSLCFFCSRRRRKALLETAEDLGCSKIATGHHRDDAVEALLMNMLYNREVSTTMPVQSLFGGSFHFIRPLYYVSDVLVKRFAAEQGIPSLEAPCPMKDNTKRDFIRRLLAAFRDENPAIDKNIFRSMFHVLNEYLPNPPDGKNAPDLPDDV